MNPIVDDMLMHYGMPRRSGRYPWGSGKNPYQHSGDFLARVEELKKQGLKETEIAKAMGFVDDNGHTQTTQLRTQISLAKDERRALLVDTAKGLREKGYSLNEIAAKMGYNNDSSVRSLLNEKSESRMKQAKATAAFLKEKCDEKGMIDVGTGVERELNISKEKMLQALEILKMDGYEVYLGSVPQATNPGQKTNLKVLCPPGTEHKEIYNYENIHSVRDYVSHDGGDTYDPKWVYPKSMDSSRLDICYAEDGGKEKDGVIEIRRGVDDLSLGNSHYAQVRILVDDNYYLKGMAVYSDDLPDGIDIRFNTNKKKGTPTSEVLKKIKTNSDNPFGSLIKEGIIDPDKGDTSEQKGGQSYYYDENGNKQLSLINKRAEEGDWNEWSNKLPSQFLSKQSLYLINKQLDLAAADKTAEYDEISSLTNPTVKKALLKTFSEECDSAAVHLQAAALPRQKYQVILPVDSMKETEVYAPNFDDGETVALIRYPHGGTFEIPILTVNNKQKDARSTIGTNPKDAIGINSKVAARLSGADFDGDTVMVIPCNSRSSKVTITSTRPFKELEEFDNKLEYGPDTSEPVKVDSQGREYYTHDGKMYKRMVDTQKEMGVISNLITDMTIKGAPDDELIRAVKHSMVIIDAEKHKLDYKQSEIDNGIAALKKTYQGTVENGKYHEGAATLISRAKSETSVPKRQGSPTINKETGALEWKNSDDPYYVDKKTGAVVVKTQPSTRMAETDDAFTLVSDDDTKIERAYATYANKMKALANQARLDILSTGKIPYSSSAKETYKEEVASLNNQLDIALMNAPRERLAQTIANSRISAVKQDNPDMTKSEIKKYSQQALTQARAETGAKRTPITISEREWEAIQAGAVTENVLTQIMKYADTDSLRQLAMPKATNAALSEAKQAKIASMAASGYSTSDIAKAVGCSTSTVHKYLK